jgi:succinyl-diaminopimelate desuccinylase
MATIDPRALTRELLAFNTINPPGMERACARHLGKILEDAGFRVAYHEFAEARTSLIAQIGGDAERPPLCFTGHIDVVPLGAAQWTRDAFAGETDGGPPVRARIHRHEERHRGLRRRSGRARARLARGPGLCW